jgi:hypothetical protein
MAGAFTSGGSIDHLFDVFRGELGKADTSIQEWFKDRLQQETDRYTIQRILWCYGDGVKRGHVSIFSGENDPAAKKTTDYITTRTGLSSDLVYNTLYGLLETSKTELSSASVLAGNGNSFFDDFMNAGATTAVTGVVNDTLTGLGLPSLANTLIILVILAIVGAIIYAKVKK